MRFLDEAFVLIFFLSDPRSDREGAEVGAGSSRIVFLFELSEREGAVIDFNAFLISTGSSLLEKFSYKDKQLKIS